ncbi:MAG: PPC domain-containing protein, partial [Halobaculum sp.]
MYTRTRSSVMGQVLAVVVTVIMVLSSVTAGATVAGTEAPGQALATGDGVSQAITGGADTPPVASHDGPEERNETDEADHADDRCERTSRNDSKSNRPAEECKKSTDQESDDETDGSDKGRVTTQVTNAQQDLRSIGIGQTSNGTIDTNDPQNATFRGYYEPVTFSGQAGQTVRVRMTSDDDTYLYLLGPSGEIIASDDDGGNGLNSELVISLPTTGEYTVIATSYDPSDTFSYRLSVTVPQERDLRSTSVGGAVFSTIESDDPTNQSLGLSYEPVTFSGQAGQDVSIEMQADIEATLPATGNYTVLAGTDDSVDFLEYELSIAADTHRDARSIAVGGAVASTVDTADPSGNYGADHYEPVTFAGQAGQELTVSLSGID